LAFAEAGLRGFWRGYFAGRAAPLGEAGLDGCEALVLRAGMDLSREMLQLIRGWDDTAWERAADRLAGRGFGDQRQATADRRRLRASECTLEIAG